MYGGGQLAFTGGGVLLFGHLMGLDLVVGAGIALVVGGITVYRVTGRLLR